MCTALVLVLLAVSGLLLNHGEDLRLGHHRVTNSYLLGLYNISVPEPSASFAVAGRHVTQIGQRVYFDTTEIAQDAENLIGAVDLDGTIVVALTGRLLLLNLSGQLIETIDGSGGVPAGMRQLGVSDNGSLAVEAAHGVYQVQIENLNWQESARNNTRWQVPARPPETLYSALAIQYRGAGLSLERVLLDLHSGRIGGAIGVWIVDATGLLVVILAASGLWIWTLRRRQRE